MNSKCSAALFVVALMVASVLPLEQSASAAPGSNRTLVAQNNDGPPPFSPPAGGDNPEPGMNVGGRPGSFAGGQDAQNRNQQWQEWKRKRQRRWMQGQGMPGEGPPAGGFGGGGGMGGLGGGMGKGPGRFHAGGHRLDLTSLNLTDQQKSRIQALHEQARGQAKEIRKRLGLKQMKLRELLFSPDATDSQILAARRDMRELQDKMDELNVKDMLAIRAVLTPEQKAKLPSIMPGRRETAGMPGGAGPGGMMPGGGSPVGFGGGDGGPPAPGPRGQKMIEMRARAKMAGQSGAPQD